MFTVLFSVRRSNKLKFQTVSEIQKLNLVLVSGECEVNCDGRRNKCNVSLEENSMKNVSIYSFISIQL